MCEVKSLGNYEYGYSEDKDGHRTPWVRLTNTITDRFYWDGSEWIRTTKFHNKYKQWYYKTN